MEKWVSVAAKDQWSGPCAPEQSPDRRSLSLESGRRLKSSNSAWNLSGKNGRVVEGRWYCFDQCWDALLSDSRSCLSRNLETLNAAGRMILQRTMAKRGDKGRGL